MWNMFGDIFMKPLLRSPLYFMANNNLMLITFTEHTDGEKFMTPAEYRHDGDCLIAFARKGRIWWENFQGSRPIILRLHGQEINAIGEVMTLDKGTKFETIRWMYPALSVEQIADLLPDVVVIRIHLPQTDIVPVSVSASQ